MRDIDPLHSSIGADENLFANLSAFGDNRNRKVLGIIGGFMLHGISVHFESEVILCITRTPNFTIHRRCKRSSSWSAKKFQKKII